MLFFPAQYIRGLHLIQLLFALSVIARSLLVIVLNRSVLSLVLPFRPALRAKFFSGQSCSGWRLQFFLRM